MTDISDELIDWFTLESTKPVKVTRKYYELLLQAHPFSVVKDSPANPNRLVPQKEYQELLRQSYESGEQKSVLAICSYCNRPRVDGEWVDASLNILEQKDLSRSYNLSHSICDSCMENVDQDED